MGLNIIAVLIPVGYRRITCSSHKYRAALHSVCSQIKLKRKTRNFICAIEM